MPVDRAAFEMAVSEKSPLTCSQIESMFGGSVNDENKAVCWRFICMPAFQQMSIWQVFCATRDIAPAFRIEAVR